MKIKRQLLVMIGQICNPKRSYKEIELNQLLNSLNIDSLSFLELIINIENRFNIEFDEETLFISDFADVASLISNVIRKLEKNS